MVFTFLSRRGRAIVRVAGNDRSREIRHPVVHRAVPPGHIELVPFVERTDERHENQRNSPLAHSPQRTPGTPRKIKCKKQMCDQANLRRFVQHFAVLDRNPPCLHKMQAEGRNQAAVRPSNLRLDGRPGCDQGCACRIEHRVVSAVTSAVYVSCVEQESRGNSGARCLAAQITSIQRRSPSRLMFWSSPGFEYDSGCSQSSSQIGSGWMWIPVSSNTS